MIDSAVPVPGRPSLTKGNDKKRPAWVVLTEEWPFGPCPERGMRLVNVEQEVTPMLVGTIAQADFERLSAAFFAEMHRLGFIEGQNLVVDRRGYGLPVEQFSEVARDQAKAQVDVIVCGGEAAARAAHEGPRGHKH